MSNTECKINRLVSIDVIAQSDKKLSAATFEFTFDEDILEFRKVSSSSSSSTVKSFLEENKIKVSYLNTYGEDINDGQAVFALTFKAIKQGTGNIDYTVSDCVDSDVKSMVIGKCTSSEVTVTQTGSDLNSKSNSASAISSGNDDNDEKNSKKSSKNNAETQIETTCTSAGSIDSLGYINSTDDNNATYLIAGIASGAALVVLAVIIFSAGRKSALKKDDSEKQDID